MKGIIGLICMGNENVVIMRMKDITNLPDEVFYYIRRCLTFNDVVICPEKPQNSGQRWQAVKDYASELKVVPCSELEQIIRKGK